jgi:DNA-binding LacI/PurR family transcriptional regulator
MRYDARGQGAATAQREDMRQPAGTGQRRPTSLDVAQRAGVSQPTVSRALRNDGSISTETRLRVEQAAAELGYWPDHHAARLRDRATGAIALVLLATPGADRGVPNPFYYDLVEAVETAAARRGLRVLLSYQGAGRALRCDFEQRREADGVIVIGSASNRTAWRFFAAAARGGSNVVGWGAPDQSLPVIRGDSRAGAALAVDHLAAAGRRRIAFVGPGWERHHAFRERRAGYLDAIARHGLEPIEATGPREGDRIEEGALAFAALTAHAPDAVFAASDGLALGVLRAARRAGLAVPAEVAVVGFDGAYGAGRVEPALTTIAQDAGAAGEALVAALLGEGGDTQVPVRLVAGESG